MAELLVIEWRRKVDVLVDLGSNPELASRLCREAQGRLMRRVSQLTDEDVQSPSRLPGWTVGHVLTHLARNADAHARRLSGAIGGRDVPKYQSGEQQRSTEIEDGATRSASEIIADLKASMDCLEEIFTQSTAAGWPNGHFLGGGHYGVAGCPAHRLREVEMHHVDLGLGYGPSDWPDEYVDWELPVLLATVPDRLDSSNSRQLFMAWLAGRGPLDSETTLNPW
ncbi:maleylpyruvate isomerase family mycothiol-dependent enzyme [Paeniglutamicibacter antarcticus]|uniref:Maleylpyruvate isomerase family mycothiol-dependent enzyme n=1 Tax=Arthrobacter terrae TaxID=2935737 RepID=A0A931CMQ2_9MICC|nr:maleylpyruvate isomerase family mycothiol-dependent enzyme [Arthrobacter terrae]MBG0738259.1 maleylpyruvate isomerase family mycothiol-dependent enzyme [Arthrobacter terrae]